MPLLLGFGPAAAGCLWESGSRASAVQGGMLPYFGLVTAIKLGIRLTTAIVSFISTSEVTACTWLFPIRRSQVEFVSWKL